MDPQQAHSDSVLEVRAVSKDFTAQQAVSEVSLEIPRGSFFSLVGPSGCGKTTLLRLIAGFETPTVGEVWLSGRRIDHLPPYQRSVNTVFQSYALFPHLTVAGNVAFGLRGDDAVTRVARALEQLQLTGKESRRPDQLSGGERQRVALARALVMEPELLLLDEPLSALDPLLRKQVRAELRDLQKRVGITFLFVTHDQEEALALSDTIAVMDKGRVEQVGSPREVYSRPRTRFVANFLGAMNWIGGVGVRPESVRLAQQGRPGVVTNVVYLGSAVHAETRLDSGDVVTAQVAPDQAPEAGAAVHLEWSTEDEVRLP